MVTVHAKGFTVFFVEVSARRNSSFTEFLHTEVEFSGLHL